MTTHSIFHWMTSVQRAQQLVTTAAWTFLLLSSVLNLSGFHLDVFACFCDRVLMAD